MAPEKGGKDEGDEEKMAINAPRSSFEPTGEPEGFSRSAITKPEYGTKTFREGIEKTLDNGFGDINAVIDFIASFEGDTGNTLELKTIPGFQSLMESFVKVQMMDKSMEMDLVLKVIRKLNWDWSAIITDALEYCEEEGFNEKAELIRRELSDFIREKSTSSSPAPDRPTPPPAKRASPPPIPPNARRDSPRPPSPVPSQAPDEKESDSKETGETKDKSWQTVTIDDPRKNIIRIEESGSDSPPGEQEVDQSRVVTVDE
jgi:hypothetical protein